MALETKLYQKMTQQLVMTPQLRQAIKILQVSRTELETLIDEELTQNPVLEDGVEGKDNGDTPATAADPQFDGVVATTTDGATPEAASTETPRDLGEIDWKDYWDNHENEFHSLRAAEAESEDDDRRPSFENVLSRTPELAEHLRWQLHLSDLSSHQQEIGEIIIGNLDVEGYLDSNVEEIANLASVSPDEVLAVLRRLQEFDPPGVCARDLRECLLIQLVQLGVGDSLAARIVRDHLSTLESRRFEKLARDLAVTVEAVVDASKVIASLEPKPGRNFGDGEIRYVVPDVFITKIGDEYVITLNDDGLPRLRLSYSYRRMLEGNPGVDVKNYLAEKKRAAEWLIKSIQQRQRTMYLVTQSIVKFQREFFERGVSGLRPLVLRDVAGDIGMHESTVSRATSNKYVHTPQGTFELKFFFTSSLRGGAGEDVSAESVKQRIRELIDKEDAKHPLSDQSIAETLGREGVDIARRTVAKYREMMGILPSSRRKSPF